MKISISRGVREVDLLSQDLQPVIDDLISEYLDPLDAVIEKSKELLELDPSGISTSDLQNLIVQIPLCLYYCQEGAESVKLKQGVSDLVRQDKYNSALLRAEGTDIRRRAHAENEVQEPVAVKLIYQTALTSLNQKMYYAEELLKSLKKVLTLRISEYEISRHQ
jgi:hypothetical protein